ncbi:PREDICTED: spermatogenesis-associated protein 33 isoform X1 [Gavialis gangeticus]|uniref:spermatogenesis-associated protein 33 isoform X1 n=1 Tax=Gavialis gangeticus TaxID=94835 RepID=UPI00092F41CB|nr:PREDICTED: spermatogenesis-associated protein 33 isoform X1 [Gavialis gangeticus]
MEMVELLPMNIPKSKRLSDVITCKCRQERTQHGERLLWLHDTKSPFHLPCLFFASQIPAADAQLPTVSQTWEQRKTDLQKHSQHIQTSPQAHTNHVQAPSGKSAKKQQQKSSGAEDRPRKKVEKLVKKKRYIIPKIIVTRPLDEEESYTDVDNLPESKTIRDTEYYGPYNVHTKPSTIEAYQVKREMP